MFIVLVFFSFFFFFFFSSRRRHTRSTRDWSSDVCSSDLKKLKGPQFLHVITRKGQGYKLAEDDPIAYHGPGKFNPAEGLKSVSGAKPTYSQVFGDWLCDMAARDPRIVGITPAMREGSGMVRYSEL